MCIKFHAKIIIFQELWGAIRGNPQKAHPYRVKSKKEAPQSSINNLA